jgi:hypothetical protein
MLPVSIVDPHVNVLLAGILEYLIISYPIPLHKQFYLCKIPMRQGSWVDRGIILA